MANIGTTCEMYVHFSYRNRASHVETNKRKDIINKKKSIGNCLPHTFVASNQRVLFIFFFFTFVHSFGSSVFIFIRFHFILYLHSFELDPDDLFECRHQEWKQQRLFLYTLFAMLVLRSCRDHLWRHRSVKENKKKKAK